MSEITDHPTINYSSDICPACGGRRTQKNKQTGINIRCPYCKGTGIDDLGSDSVTLTAYGGTDAWDK